MSYKNSNKSFNKKIYIETYINFQEKQYYQRIDLYYFFILVFFIFLQNGRSSSESSDDTDRWQPLFVAVTDRELR